MKHKMDFLYCNTPLSSKELGSNAFTFFKSASHSIHPPVTPPETYLCDILLEKNLPLEEFIQLFTDSCSATGMMKTGRKGTEKSPQTGTALPFTCAVIHNEFTALSTDSRARVLAEKNFEQILNDHMERGKGIWHRLCDSAVIMVVHKDPKEAENIIAALLENGEKIFRSPCRAGASVFPHSTGRKDNADNAHGHGEPTTWAVSPHQTIYNAVKALDHAAFLPPGALIFFNDVTQNIFGDRLYCLGMLEEAASQYRKGIKLNPENINLFNSLGVCYSLMNQLKLAREQFEAALKVDSTDFMALYNAGLTCNLLDDLEKGIKYLKKATELNSSLYDAELTAAILLIKADRSADEALTHLNNAARLNPKSAMVRRILGDLHLKLDQPEMAAQEYTQAIKLNPGDAGSVSGLARAYEVQNKNIDIALDLACQSLEIAPHNPYFRIRLARIYLKKGNFDFADIEFSKAEKHLREIPYSREFSRHTCVESSIDKPSTAANMQGDIPTEKKSA